MSFVNVKANIYSATEKEAKLLNISVSELTHQALNFYFSYLNYLKDEKAIIQMLDNLNNSSVSNEEKKKEADNVREKLSNYFFKDVNDKIKLIE